MSSSEHASGKHEKSLSPEIGSSPLRIAGKAKVTGELIYPSDLYLENTLHLHVFRSEIAHARILSLDTGNAKKLPGVECVITHTDLPGKKKTGLLIRDMPVLCRDKVRREGDPIAIIAAKDIQTARDASKLIRVEYEPLPAVTNAREALLPRSEKVHADGNLVGEYHFSCGDVAEAFNSADRIFEYEYRSGRQEHAFLETEGGIAYYDSEGRLTVRFGGQHPHWDAEIIAAVLGVNRDSVRVISPMMGGSFGGKDDIDVQLYLALVTYLTKQPCRIHYTRKESLVAGNKRHPYTTLVKTSCDKKGKITAAEIAFYADTGAYAGWGDKVLNTSVGECFGPYQIPNTKIDAYCVYTNNSNASAFRGFGAPQAVFPLESQIDQMAKAYDIDPLEFREMNLVKDGEITPLGVSYQGDWSIREVISTARQSELIGNKVSISSANAHKRRGLGIAAAIMGIGYGAGVPDQAEIHISLQSSGRYQIQIGGTDMGQGNATALMQMAAFELDCSLSQMDLVLGDSAGPDSGSCDAARQMTIVGRAAVAAAVDLREKILQAASKELNMSQDLLTLSGLEIQTQDRRITQPLEGLGQLTGIGLANIPDKEAVLPGLPAHLYTSGVQIALVEVDTQTGQIEVLEIESIIDAGRIINRQGIEGQTEGGIIQALGYTLLEDAKTSDGIIQTRGFSTYLIPTVMDIPDKIKMTFLEEASDLGPYGAKGISEIVLVPTAPAITNAVFDATGIRITDLPVDPQMVLEKIKMVDNEDPDY